MTDEIKTSSPEETAGKEGKETVERIAVKLEKPYALCVREHGVPGDRPDGA